jgi:hypothetical protein
MASVHFSVEFALSGKVAVWNYNRLYFERCILYRVFMQGHGGGVSGKKKRSSDQHEKGWHTGCMRTAADVETAISVRCAALGLARSQAQALADSEPFPSDLVHVLGLNRETLAPLATKSWLWVAAMTSSVSYRSVLTPETLLAVLVSSNVPDEFKAHVMHFLNEAPMQIVVMAIEQAAQQSGVPIVDIWRNVAQLNRKLQGVRFGAVGDSMGIVQFE